MDVIKKSPDEWIVGIEIEKLHWWQKIQLKICDWWNKKHPWIGWRY